MVKPNNRDERAAQEQSSSVQFSTSQESAENLSYREGKTLLDLRLDTAFKIIFKQEIFMIDLLNSILDRKEKITAITELPTESVPSFIIGKKVVFDLKCTLDTGEIIIVEMQYASQYYFRERALYYVARNIDHQLERFDDEIDKAKSKKEEEEKYKKYRIDPVWGIFILNFSLEDEKRMMRDIQLTDILNENKPFSDKMRMIFLELPTLKRPEECDTDLKKWLYVIYNSKTMDTIPFTNDKPIFKQLAEKAKYTTLTPEERDLYERDRRNEIAYRESILYAEMKAAERGRAEGLEKGIAEGLEKGIAEGRAEGKIETARKLMEELGWSAEKAASFVGLSVEQLQ